MASPPLPSAPPVAAAGLAGPAPYAWGWFVVEQSALLLPDTVVRLRHFGREWVLFRDAAGAPAMAEAHCPHLGTHLGHGGTVRDGCVRCPRHGWRFDGAGRCVEVPYAARIPEGARLATLPTAEHSGLVLAWHHPRGAPPSYEIPPVAEWGAPGWTPWAFEAMTIATQPREIVENVVDVQHFGPVHETIPQVFENTFEGHRAVQRSAGYGADGNRFAGSTYRVTATYHGPAYQVTEFESRGMEARLVNAHTPIDERTLILRFGVLLRDLGDVRRTERFRAAYVQDLARGFAQDVAIWEHKRWRDRPLLADGDGPIPALRAWYAQFFR